MRAKITMAAACVACVCVMGCNGGSKTTAQKESAGTVMASNTACPFSGGKVNPKFSSTYNGHAVGFCCGGCKAKFDAMNDADRAKLMAGK